MAPFRITGHRGAMGYMPENTIPSYVRAVQDGVDEVELDLRLTKDGHIVLIHDPTVDRTTNGHGAVEDFTLAELRRLDAGNGEHIPTFEEAVEAVDITILAEIKADAAVEPLRRLLADRPELRQRVQPISFRAERLVPLVYAFSDLRCALLSETGSEQLLEQALSIGMRWVGVGWQGSSPELIKQAQNKGLEYCLWPAPTRTEVDRAIAWGANGVTTDYPERVIRPGSGPLPVP
ncbi:glycerophosphodiester phosphodiesterase [Kribbella sp. NPDC054772]